MKGSLSIGRAALNREVIKCTEEFPLCAFDKVILIQGSTSWFLKQQRVPLRMYASSFKSFESSSATDTLR